MLRQSIGMTENNAKQIAEMYLSRYNPTYWDGSGKVPSEGINSSKESRKPSPFESFTRIGFCTKKHATTTFVQMIFSGSDRPCCE